MQGRQHLSPLTSLRFFAASSIVLFHMLGTWGLPSAKATGLYLGIGVELFFVLSGFILAYSYPSVRGLPHALKIIGYRLARIWPLHAVMLLAFLVFAYDAANPMHDLGKIWASVLLVQSWVGNYTYAFNGNGVAWTLSVELFFYILFPFLMMLSNRMIVVVTILIAAATIQWAQAVHQPGVAVTDSVISGSAIMRMHPGAFLGLFTAGMIAGRLFVARPWLMERGKATALEAVALTAAIVFTLYNHEITSWVVRTSGITGYTSFWVRHMVGVVFFLPAIFVLAIGRGTFSQMLSHRTLVFLGEASFALYLLHMVVKWAFVGWGFHSPVTIPFYVGAILLGAAALHLHVEKPANRYCRALIDATARALRPAAAAPARSQ